MNKLLTAFLAISPLIFGVGEAKAGTLLIDDFDTQFQSVEVIVPLTGDIVFPLQNEDTSDFSSNIVGGYRNIFVELIDAETKLSGVKANVVPEISIDNGLLTISNDDGVLSKTVVSWDNDGNGLGINLLETGFNTNAFDLNVSSIDLDTDLTFTVKGNNGETATLFQNNLNTIGSNLFSYEEFALSGGTYDDIFSDVQSIALEIVGEDLDASFDSFNAVNTDNSSSVPEPTSVLSLLGLMGFGCSLGMKKKLKNKF